MRLLPCAPQLRSRCARKKYAAFLLLKTPSNAKRISSNLYMRVENIPKKKAMSTKKNIYIYISGQLTQYAIAKIKGLPEERSNRRPEQSRINPHRKLAKHASDRSSKSVSTALPSPSTPPPPLSPLGRSRSRDRFSLLLSPS